MPVDADLRQRATLVLMLRSRGHTNQHMLRAFETTDRAAFAPIASRADAYADRLVPLPCGQVMEAPDTLAMLVSALDIRPEHRVLEIGTGSGYLTALLAQLCHRVISLERYHSLHQAAQSVLAAGGVRNADLIVEDGLAGELPGAPFDRIIATGAVADIPQSWSRALTADGKIVAAVGEPPRPSAWHLYHRRGDGEWIKTVLGPSYCAMLTPDVAQVL